MKASVLRVSPLRVFAYPLFLAFVLFLVPLESLHARASASVSEEDLREPIPSPQVSMLFCGGRLDPIYTIYGHVALRVKDTVAGSDWVYNWGIFDFNAPNFIGKFVKGTTTDYQLGVEKTEDFLRQYNGKGVEVKEVQLLLNAREIDHLLTLIGENLQDPYYHYNFVFDNCSTRPFELLNRVVEGTLTYPPVEPLTRRQMVDGYAKDRPWLKFGTDIVLGLPADRPTEAREQLFLPDYAHAILKAMKIQGEDGRIRPLGGMETTHPFYSGTDQKPLPKLPFPLLPLSVTIFLFIVTAFTAFYRGYNSRWFKVWGTVYLLLMGLVGCLVCYLSFFSLHPLVRPNYNILVFHPLLLLISMPTLWMPRNTFGYVYHTLIVLEQLIFLLFVGWLSAEVFNPAVILLSLGVIAISMRYLYPLLSKHDRTLPKSARKGSYGKKVGRNKNSLKYTR